MSVMEQKHSRFDMVLESVGLPKPETDSDSAPSTPPADQAGSPAEQTAADSARPQVVMRSKARRPPANPTDEALQDLNSAQVALQKAMGTLAENEDGDDEAEIRRLDSQLDHLNEYMDKVEARLRAHNQKLVETLNQQKQEREKRRQSFHETNLQRQQTSRQEDDEFQKQLAELLGQISMSKKRSSLLADIDLSSLK